MFPHFLWRLLISVWELTLFFLMWKQLLCASGQSILFFFLKGSISGSHLMLLCCSNYQFSKVSGKKMPFTIYLFPISQWVSLKKSLKYWLDQDLYALCALKRCPCLNSLKNTLAIWLRSLGFKWKYLNWRNWEGEKI